MNNITYTLIHAGALFATIVEALRARPPNLSHPQPDEDTENRYVGPAEQLLLSFTSLLELLPDRINQETSRLLSERCSGESLPSVVRLFIILLE